MWDADVEEVGATTEEEKYPTPRAAVSGVPAYSVIIEGQADDSREDLFKRPNCPAMLIKGQPVCFACGRQAAERVKHQNLRHKINSRRREIEGRLINKFGRNVVEASASDLGHVDDVHVRSRSFEADTLDNARKNAATARRRGFTSILDRHMKDDLFMAAVGRRGLVRSNLLVMDLLVKSVIPNPGRDSLSQFPSLQDSP